MKRILAILLCLSLLLGSASVLAEGAAVSAPRENVTDVEPPDIISITLKENKKTLKPGNKLHVEVKLSDRSTVNEVRAQFFNESKEHYISFDLHYDAGSDSFKGEYTLSKLDVNGSYVLNYLNAEDKYGNSSFRWDGKGIASFKLTGAADDGYVKGKVSFKENGKTLRPGDQMYVEVKLSSAVKKATHAIVWFKLEGRDNYSSGYHIDMVSSKEYKGSFSFEEGVRNGKYNLTSVTIEDDDWNTLATVKVSGLSVTIKGGSDDNKPPVFSSVTLKEKGKTLTAGDTVHVSLAVKDASRIQYVDAGLYDKEPVSFWDEKTNQARGKNRPGTYIEMHYNSSTKKYEGSLVLPANLPDGKYRLYVYAGDEAGNYVDKAYDKQYIIYKSPDVVDNGMKDFLGECFRAFLDKDPTAAEVKKYGMPLASGEQKAVDVILTVMKKSGLTSGEAAAKALWQVMQGKQPDASALSKTVANLKTGAETAIDALNNKTFRQRCNNWGIVPGNLGSKTSDTKVSSVEVNGGRYILKGSKASLAGVTDRNIKNLVIPDTVTANGKTYKVTEIEPIACRALGKLASLTIGKNVKKIGQFAFADCKKLKKITVLSTKLKTVAAGAFENIKKTAAFKCPKGKASKYKKLFQAGGAPKKAKFN